MTKTYKVELRGIRNPQGLKLGMSGDVNIFGKVADNALLVPATALVTDGNTPAVWVVENGRAYKRFVRTGARDAERVEVKDGIALSAVVIVNPPSSLRNGQQVSVRKGDDNPQQR